MVDAADENICDNRLLFYTSIVRLVSVSIRTEFLVRGQPLREA